MSFDLALKIVLANEGGYVDDPRDPGGATNRGVTQAVYRRFKHDATADVRELTAAETAAIYRWWYWAPAGCVRMAEPLATVAFDTAVNCGPGELRRLLERAGAWTARSALTGATTLLQVRGQFYRDLATERPKLRVFLAGWLRRVARLRAYCDDPAAQAGGYLPRLKRAA